MPVENTSESMLLVEEPILRVARVGEVSVAVGSSELASSSLMTTAEPQGASSELSLLLRRRGSKVVLGYGNFCRILK